MAERAVGMSTMKPKKYGWQSNPMWSASDETLDIQIGVDTAIKPTKYPPEEHDADDDDRDADDDDHHHHHNDSKMFYKSGRYSYEEQIDNIMDRLKNLWIVPPTIAKVVVEKTVKHKTYTTSKTNLVRNVNFSIPIGDRLCMSDEARERDELVKQMMMMKMRWRKIGSMWIEANFLLEW